jgi:hypothetical protein
MASPLPSRSLTKESRSSATIAGAVTGGGVEVWPQAGASPVAAAQATFPICVTPAGSGESARTAKVPTAEPPAASPPTASVQPAPAVAAPLRDQRCVLPATRPWRRGCGSGGAQPRAFRQLAAADRRRPRAVPAGP